MRKSRKADKRAAAAAAAAAARISGKAEGRTQRGDTKAARTKCVLRARAGANGIASSATAAAAAAAATSAEGSAFGQRSFLRLGRVISLAFARRVGWAALVA